eukprot:TRINITY_DN13450_c0_g1_i3.p1 TRINITY_DN13450_c0_g1~~TRINITY_DN13450_c0_g1_i3.p1  ORF type:complete len:615 (-),score=98.57 TRINITY_DN13450_c0_g1_i3:130-1974(-)
MLEADEAFFMVHGEALFSSHTLDLSEGPDEENIAICQKYFTRMSPLQCILEIDIGITGGIEDGVDSSGTAKEKLYSTPEDVWAVFMGLIMISPMFTIAAAFGNVHGVDKAENVVLKPELLQDMQNYVQARTGMERPLNFVFHSSSGSEQHHIVTALAAGVVKMNADTDTQWAYWKGFEAFQDLMLEPFTSSVSPVMSEEQTVRDGFFSYDDNEHELEGHQHESRKNTLCTGSGVNASSSAHASDREHQASRKQTLLKKVIGEERIIDMFRAYDQDRDGYVSADELADVLSQVGLGESQVRSILRAMDVDGDGRCSMAEFTEWLFRDTRDQQQVLTAAETANEGWGLHRLEDPLSEEFSNIRKLFQVTDPHNLGIGRDVRSWKGKYSDIDVVCAWKIYKPYAKVVYDAKKLMYCKDNQKIRKVLGDDGPDYPFPTKLDGPGRDLFKLDDSVNEKALLHGTKAGTVLALLRNGLDERYSGGLFGKGAYLAEDPSKIDQYCTESSGGSDEEQLHQFLYDDFERPMPDTPLFYCFVVRALLGAYIRTRDGETSCDVEDQSVWATSDRRQLAQIPNVVPATPYQSLVAETGGKVARHREFIVFNGDCCKLEYLIAYRRV